MKIYHSEAVNKAIATRLEEGCREHLKKTAYRYIKTGREDVYAHGMMMAAEIGQATDGKILSITTVMGGILLFEGEEEEVLRNIGNIVRTNIDTPLKVLGKMAFIRMKRFETELKARNSSYEGYAANNAHIRHGQIEEMPVLNKKELWGPAMDMLNTWPWGNRASKPDSDFKKFLARDEVTDEVLQVGWDMWLTKSIIES